MEEKIPFGEEHPRERRKRIQESPNDKSDVDKCLEVNSVPFLEDSRG